MPAVITHDFFAQDAFGAAQAVHAMPTRDERDAFLLGSQGPDPLFYLPPVAAMRDFQQLATTLHHETPSAHLVELRRAADGLPEDQRPVGYAYLAGYACHWLLDSMVHPFVYFWERGLCQAGVEGLDLSDKVVVPFTTHGGSGLGSVPQNLQSLAPDASFLDGLAVAGTAVEDSKDEIVSWAKGLSL